METFEINEDLIKRFQSGAISNEDIVAAFNPANAATIPESILQFMPHLTFEQIKLLANAYPNKPTHNSYLILKDNNFKGRQAFPRSTWQNLFNLRKTGGSTTAGMVAHTFTSRFNLATTARQIKTAPVQDITSTEGLPGIVSAPVQKISEAGAQNEAGTTTAGDGGANTTRGGEIQAIRSEPEIGAKNAINGPSDEFEELTIEDIKQDQKNEGTEDKSLQSKASTISALTEDNGTIQVPAPDLLAAGQPVKTEPEKITTTTGRTVNKAPAKKVAAAKKAAAKKAGS